MDGFCRLTDVALLRSHGSSASCVLVLLTYDALFLGVMLLFSLARRGNSSSSYAGGDASFCSGDIIDTSIPLSPSFTNDREFIDLSETTVTSSKVCERL